MAIVKVLRQVVSKRFVGCNDFFEKPFLHIPRQIGPEANRTVADGQGKSSVVVSHPSLLPSALPGIASVNAMPRRKFPAAVALELPCPDAIV